MTDGRFGGNEEKHMESKNQPIRILQVLKGGPVCGGIENFVMNYYRHIDRKRVQFDFLVHSKKKGYYDDEIKALGGEIYYLSLLDDRNVVRYIGDLFHFFTEHKEYRIIHGQVRGFAPVYFMIALLCGVPIRISHSHVNNVESTFTGRMLNAVVSLIKYCSNVHWACSLLAGEYMYGNRGIFQVIPNAISTKRFFPKPQIREEVRKELRLEGKFVIGNIGRYCLQKNQKFLLRIFESLLQIIPDSMMLLIGEGELKKELQEEARQLGIDSFVCFLPPQTCIENYYQAMDVFVLPSFFEGFPLVLVEAQACQVLCVTSTNVTTEANLSGNIRYLSLELSPMEWAEAIIEQWESKTASSETTQNKQYDIEYAAVALMKKYENLDRFGRM